MCKVKVSLDCKLNLMQEITSSSYKSLHFRLNHLKFAYNMYRLYSFISVFIDFHLNVSFLWNVIAIVEYTRKSRTVIVHRNVCGKRIFLKDFGKNKNNQTYEFNE